MTDGTPLRIVDPERKVVGGDGHDAVYRSPAHTYKHPRRSLRDSFDLVVAFLFVFLLLAAAHFADLDSNYASSMRLTSVFRHVLGLRVTAPAPTDATAGGKFILVAEKDNGQRLIAKTTLERYGYDVRLADSGSQALALFRKAAPRVSLVLLDRSELGGCTGSVVQQLKQIRPDVRILVSRSGGDELPCGVTRIAGPLSAPPLTETVRKVLASD